MKPYWTLPKAQRKEIDAKEKELNKKLKDHQDSLNRTRNVVAHHEYQISLIENELANLVRQFFRE